MAGRESCYGALPRYEDGFPPVTGFSQRPASPRSPVLNGKGSSSTSRPDHFGPFRVRADLGVNRFGPVYLGHDPSTKSRVVIRSFELSPEWREFGELSDLLDSFRRLCETTLDHATLARPLAFGTEGDIPYLVYSDLPGTGMDAVMRQDGPRPLAEVLQRTKQLADAIECAASAGVHHGMLAPADVILDAERTGVTGFGLAQALIKVEIPAEAISPYGSPQRLAGAPPTLADDIYSLAAIALELLIGTPPDPNQEREALGLVERRRIPRPAPHETRVFTTIAGVDAGKLRAAFAAAFSEEPSERPSTASAFVASFQDACSNRRETDEPAQSEGAVPVVSDQREDPPSAPASEVKPAPVLDTKPAPAPEVKPAPVLDTKPVPVPEVKPAPVMGTKPAPVPEVKPAPVMGTKPAPVPEVKPAPVVDTKPAPVPEVKPTPVVDTKPAPVTEVKPAPVLDTKLAPVPEVKPAPLADTKSAPVTDTKRAPVTDTKPAPVLDMKRAEDGAIPKPPSRQESAVADKQDALPISKPLIRESHEHEPRERKPEIRVVQPEPSGAVALFPEETPLPRASSIDAASYGIPVRTASPGLIVTMLVAVGFASFAAGFGGGFMVGQRSRPSTDSINVTQHEPVAEPQPTRAAVEAPKPVVSTPPTVAPVSKERATTSKPIASTASRQPAVPAVEPRQPAAPAVEPRQPAAPAIESRQPSGRLLVRSRPAGADVMVDGQPSGITPLTLRELALGAHTIEVSYPGHDPRRQRVTLSERRPARSVDFALRPTIAPADVTRVATVPADVTAPTTVPADVSRPTIVPADVTARPTATGSLQVASRPSGAQVFVDDNLIGTTPFLLSNVTAGSRSLRIELSGYQTWTTSVHIKASARARVSANLEP